MGDYIPILSMDNFRRVGLKEKKEKAINLENRFALFDLLQQTLILFI